MSGSELPPAPWWCGDVIGEGASQESAVLGETRQRGLRVRRRSRSRTRCSSRRKPAGWPTSISSTAISANRTSGLNAPVQAWQVVRERATSALRHAARRRRHPAGRPHRRACHAAAPLEPGQGGRRAGGAAFRQPGIGKSRGADLVRKHRGGAAHPIRYQCSPYHTNSALYPIAEQLRRMAGIDAGDNAETQLGKLETMLALAFDDVSEVAPLFAALLSIDVGKSLRGLVASAWKL